MPLATKNGSLIIKNGSVAENCNCCKEGACCEGTSCSIKPRFQCQGAGQTFKGVGTTCSPDPCDYCVAACSPNPTHPITLAMEISGFTGASPAKFSINATKTIGRQLVYAGTQTCWAYSYLLADIGDQCPNPGGAQVIDGFSLSAIFSTGQARLFANYKDNAGTCHRYDISWSLTGNGTAQSRLCVGDFPFSGTVASQGVSFNYTITRVPSNPLP